MGGELDLNGGVWRAVDPPAAWRTLEGEAPPLLPAARAAWEARAEPAAVSRDVAAARQCRPPGVPRLLLLSPAFEVQQRPDQLVIFYEWNRLLRVVPLNVPQREVLGPSYLGQSVGRWEGRALRVETIGFGDATVLDASGLPHSDQLRVTEDYALAPEGRLEVVITIDDPKTYARPWRTRMTFRHDPQGEIQEDVCLERVRGRTGAQP